jgi:hypothetical protein
MCHAGQMSTPTDPPILVVEDDADLRELLAFALRRAGYNVHTAATGRDALAQLAVAPPLPPRDAMYNDGRWRVAHAFTGALPGWAELRPRVLTYLESLRVGSSATHPGAHRFVVCRLRGRGVTISQEVRSWGSRPVSAGASGGGAAQRAWAAYCCGLASNVRLQSAEQK